MFDREFLASLAMCALGLAVAGVAAAPADRPAAVLEQAVALKVTAPLPLSYRCGLSSLQGRTTRT